MSELAVGVNSSETLWTVDEVPDPEFDLYTVGSEIVQVIASFPETQGYAVGQTFPAKIRVIRATNGTSAATHAQGVALTAANAFADSGGGGGGSDTRVTVDLTAAQIRTLDTIPVEAIPTPGAGKFIYVKSFWASYTFVTTPYDGGQASLSFDTNPTGYGIHVEDTFVLSVGASHLIYQPAASYYGTGAAASPLNLPLIVVVTSPPGVNGDGTLRWVIDYEIVTL